MKKNTIWSLLAGVLISLAFASCDTSSEFDDTVSNDCAVTGVTLGTLLRTISNPDTTYTVNVTGSLYPMSIDQLNNRIFNADSLPLNTNVDRVVFSTFSATGSVSIKSLTNDKDTLFVRTDSTDFTRPRTIKVYSADGTMHREYSLEVNVHKEEADSFVWKRMTTDDESLLTKPYTQTRLIHDDNTLYFFGQETAGCVTLLTASATNGVFVYTGRSTTCNPAFDVRSIQRFDNDFWALSGNHLVRATDGCGWGHVNDNVALTALIGATTDSLYALNADHQMVASDDGINWTEVTREGEALFPTSDMASTYAVSHTDDNITTLLWLGRQNGDTMSVWKHDIDTHLDVNGEPDQHTFPWVNIPQTEELHTYGCPALSQPSIMPYDGGIAMIGLKADGSVAPFYHSADLGRIWKSGSYRMPAIATGATSIAAVADDAHHVWIVCSGTGEVWRGRINRLAWSTDDQIILKARRR